MRAKRWVIASPDTERVRVLSRETGYTPLTAAVLSARGIDTPQAAADYLSCDVRGLHDPFGLTDMDKAVEVVREVIDRGEKMVVYGDYDVDGITATCTLVDYLRSKGAKCEYYIPNRLTDGYGLTRPAMEQLYEQGTRLLITVDSGITANEEIAVARELGMQVVITDHHECHENLPDAQAVVDCKRTDDTYPFSSLAGVGVAFKLICALEGDTLSMLDRYADLVALGTVADVMPIVGENRIIVAEGLKKLSVTANIGLEMLLREAGMKNRRLTSSTISYVLAPRINAAGRMGKAELAAELFLSGRSGPGSGRSGLEPGRYRHRVLAAVRPLRLSGRAHLGGRGRRRQGLRPLDRQLQPVRGAHLVRGFVRALRRSCACRRTDRAGGQDRRTPHAPA